MLHSPRAERTPREGAGQLSALLLNQGPLPFGHQARDEEQGLRLAKEPGMRGLVLLFAGVMLCCFGILLSLPATALDLPSAFAGADAAQVDGGANAPPPDGSYPITPVEEVRETDRHPVNASLLTMLLLALSFGACVLWMSTNDRRRGATCSWGVVDDRPWLAVAYEGASFLGVFRL
jgi:hypothetical protein